MEKVANTEILQSFTHVVKMTPMAVLGRNTQNYFVFCCFNKTTISQKDCGGSSSKKLGLYCYNF